MKLNPLCSIGLLIIAALFFSGCGSSGYSTYPRTSVGTSQSVSKGTVLDVRNINVEGKSSHVGYSSGAILGGAVGQTAGSGTGRILASAGGAVVGGIVGTQVEKAMTAQIAQEVTIELDDGSLIVVVQKNNGPDFIEGDRVEVLESRRGDAVVRHEYFGSV